MWELDCEEGWRIDAFELWCWRRLSRVPWTTRRPNQSILKEINLEYSLEELMLRLKLQYFDHLIQRTDSYEKTLMLGKIEGRRRRGDRGWDGWMALLTWWTWVWASSGSWWWTGKSGMLQSMESQGVRRDWVTKHSISTVCICQTHVHQVGNAIQPSHPLSSPSPPSPNPSQHQSLSQWVNSLHEVAKVLEFQLDRKKQSYIDVRW